MRFYTILFMIFLCSGCIFPKPETNINKYYKIKSQFPPEYIGHFPDSLGEIKRVKMYYFPKFLQGGMSFQLFCEYSKYGDFNQVSTFERLVSQFDTLKMKNPPVYGDKFSNEEPAIPSSGFPVYDPFGENNCRILPTSFEIDIIDANEVGNWNHGFSRGVAIEKNLKQIIYWIEKW